MLSVNAFAHLFALSNADIVGISILTVVGLLLLTILPWMWSRSFPGRIRMFLGPFKIQGYFTRNVPSFRFVDYGHAAQRLVAQSPGSEIIGRPTDWRFGYKSLQMLLNEVQLAFGLKPANQRRFCTGYERFEFLPDDMFALLAEPLGSKHRVVVRICLFNATLIEIGAPSSELAHQIFDWLEADALKHSIYRGQFLEIDYQPNRPHYDNGYYQPAHELIVQFKAKPTVQDHDIILEEKIRELLKRNVFSFSQHRSTLFEVGIPRKRALLFYGPPGTGKTHTCRYIHSQLQDITTILAAGQSLTRLDEIGQFSRQLHPALVVIEDVDLVFMQRELNPYGSTLGALMDQLDGFTPDEEVIFLLTTNAIERVEEAIRNRPGRINQCVFFDLPNPELRRLFLQQYLSPYDVTRIDFDHVVKQTERTTQAFLKEYVLRAVQIAVERQDFRLNGKLCLETSYFDVAYDELISHGNPAGQAIMGFHTR